MKPTIPALLHPTTVQLDGVLKEAKEKLEEIKALVVAATSSESLVSESVSPLAID